MSADLVGEHWVVSVGALSKAFDAALGRRVQQAQGAVACTVVTDADEAVRVSRQAAQAGVPRLIAAGGDGTIHSVVNGVYGTQAVVGVLPSGTANDFARAAGLADLPLEQAMDVACTGTTHPVDLMDAGDRYTVNVITIGFAASISESVPRSLKDALGGLAYPLHALREVGSWSPVPLSVETANRNWSGEALGMCICNGVGAGGGLPLAPDALLDDGVLDVVIIPADGPWSSAARLAEALLNGATSTDGIVHIPTRSVRVVAREPVAVSFDGEARSQRELAVHVAPGAVHIPLGETARIRR